MIKLAHDYYANYNVMMSVYEIIVKL